MLTKLLNRLQISAAVETAEKTVPIATLTLHDLLRAQSLERLTSPEKAGEDHSMFQNARHILAVGVLALDGVLFPIRAFRRLLRISHHRHSAGFGRKPIFWDCHLKGCMCKVRSTRPLVNFYKATRNGAARIKEPHLPESEGLTLWAFGWFTLVLYPVPSHFPHTAQPSTATPGRISLLQNVVFSLTKLQSARPLPLYLAAASVDPAVPQFSPERIKEMVAALEVPSDASVIGWRITNTMKNGHPVRGQVVPYADQRAYTDPPNAFHGASEGRAATAVVNGYN